MQLKVIKPAIGEAISPRQPFKFDLMLIWFSFLFSLCLLYLLFIALFLVPSAWDLELGSCLRARIVWTQLSYGRTWIVPSYLINLCLAIGSYPSRRLMRCLPIGLRSALFSHSVALALWLLFLLAQFISWEDRSLRWLFILLAVN